MRKKEKTGGGGRVASDRGEVIVTGSMLEEARTALHAQLADYFGIEPGDVFLDLEPILESDQRGGQRIVITSALLMGEEANRAREIPAAEAEANEASASVRIYSPEGYFLAPEIGGRRVVKADSADSAESPATPLEL